MTAANSAPVKPLKGTLVPTAQQQHTQTNMQELNSV